MSDSIIRRYGLVFFTIALLIAFSIASPEIFATGSNLAFILQVNGALAVLALGSIVPLAAGEFDLTVGAVAGLSAIIVARLGQAGVPFFASLIVAILVGVVVGLVNSFVVSALHVSSLITTLGTMSVVGGLTLFLTGGSIVSLGVPEGLVSFMQQSLWNVPLSMIIVAIVAVILWYLLNRTPLGRSLYAMGMNRDAAVLMGSRVKRNVTICFIISGVAATIAGVMLLGSQQAASPALGGNLLLPALAVAFLGASTIQPGWFNVLGTLVAVFMVGASIIGLQSVGVPYWVEPIFFGGVLIVAVAVSATSSGPVRQLLHRLFGRRSPEEPVFAEVEVSSESNVASGDRT